MNLSKMSQLTLFKSSKYHISYSTFHENESLLKFLKLIIFSFRNSRPEARQAIIKVNKLVL